MGYRKTKDVLAMANLLLNTRPDASAAEVMRKAAGMLRDLAEERAHLTQPAQAVDVGAIREVIECMRAFDYPLPPCRDFMRDFEERIARALSAEKAGWRDMGSAPVSGVILLRVESGGDVRTMVAEATCRDGVWDWMVTSGWTGWYLLLHSGWTPTGWQPLPASPTPDMTA